ncbi:hypothetical protein Peur_048020 [Populus x canadensis]
MVSTFQQVPVGSKKESPPLPGDWINLVPKSKGQALVLFPCTHNLRIKMKMC